MKIEFADFKAANVFIDKMSENYGKEVEIFGQNYMLKEISVSQYASYFVTVDLQLIHCPKSVSPEWRFGEDMLKNLRQENKSLVKFTEKAIAMFISSGEAETYLSKYNRDGTKK